jgi:hypothetical protein
LSVEYITKPELNRQIAEHIDGEAWGLRPNACISRMLELAACIAKAKVRSQ